MARWRLAALALAVQLSAALALGAQGTGSAQGDSPRPDRMLNATHHGYLDVDRDRGSAMFYMFYEAREPQTPLQETPIILWLQVRARPSIAAPAAPRTSGPGLPWTPPPSWAQQAGAPTPGCCCLPAIVASPHRAAPAAPAYSACSTSTAPTASRPS
jgi:hypothetical protein